MRKSGKWSLLGLMVVLMLLSTANVRIYAMAPKELLTDIFERQGLTKGAFELNIKMLFYKGKKVDSAQVRVFFGNGNQQLVTFVEPARMRNNYYLVNDHNTWMYQQGLQRPIRISAQQKLFGDAGIAETAGIDYLNDYHIIHVTENDDQYLLELKAREMGTAYQAANLTVSKAKRQIEQIVLKALNGQNLKRLVYHDYRLVDGHEVAIVEIYNLFQAKENKTVMEYTGIKSRTYRSEIFDPLMMGKIRI